MPRMRDKTATEIDGNHAMTTATASIQSPLASEAIITMSHVEKWYGAFQALHDINMSVRRARGSCFAARRAAASRH